MWKDLKSQADRFATGLIISLTGCNPFRWMVKISRDPKWLQTGHRKTPEWNGALPYPLPLYQSFIFSSSSFPLPYLFFFSKCFGLASVDPSFPSPKRPGDVPLSSDSPSLSCSVSLAWRTSQLLNFTSFILTFILFVNLSLLFRNSKLLQRWMKSLSHWVIILSCVYVCLLCLWLSMTVFVCLVFWAPGVSSCARRFLHLKTAICFRAMGVSPYSLQYNM